MATAALAQPAVEWDVIEQVGLWSDAWQRFRRNRLAVAGLTVVILMVLIAALSPVLTALHVIPGPYKQDVVNQLAGPSRDHLIGTDVLGRDMLSRIMYGSQISLAVGILVQVLVLAIGGSIGMAAGYLGGRVDNLLMRFTDIMYAFPDLLLVLIFVAAFGGSLQSIFIAIGVTSWVGLARLVRGQVLSIKEKEYVEAARATGTPPIRIILKHLVPNSLGPVIVTLTFGIPAAIFTEAVLDFLGVGLQAPTTSWGVMVNDGYEYIYADPLL